MELWLVSLERRRPVNKMPRDFPKGLVIVPMDQEEAKKAIEGHENVLEKAYKAHREYFERLSCYRCGGKIQEFVDSSRLFRENSPLPNYLARCMTCGCEFEPYTGIEVTLPRPSKMGVTTEVEVLETPEEDLLSVWPHRLR